MIDDRGLMEYRSWKESSHERTTYEDFAEFWQFLVDQGMAIPAEVDESGCFSKSFLEKFRNRLRGVDCEIHLQRWGQLMGSPVSFPILSFINAAITRAVLEKAYSRVISLNDGALLINGDDIISPMPPGEYQNWVKAVSSAGLKPSVGKNYLHRRYLVINSKVIDCNGWDERDWVRYPPKELNILKMNLLWGGRLKDSLGSVLGDKIKFGKTLGTKFRELVKGLDPESAQVLLKRAYRHTRGLLAQLPPVDWTLPMCLGGLDLPALSTHKVSDLHRKIATMILCWSEKNSSGFSSLGISQGRGVVFC